MAFKVRFEAELDDKLKDEIEFWGFSVDEIVKEGMEHSMWGAIRRKADNLCRTCKKPFQSSIPVKDRLGHTKGFCACRK